jgi:hypothetical protein
MAQDPDKRQRAKRKPGDIGNVTKLTPEVSATICKETELALSLEKAANLADVDLSTVKHWIKRGKETGEEPYASFAIAIARARAQAAKNFTLIALSGRKGSDKATFFLERRFREDYGPVNRLEHSGPDGGPIAHTDITKVSDEDLAKIIKGE